MSAALLGAAVGAAIVIGLLIVSELVGIGRSLKTLAAIANRTEDRDLIRSNMAAAEREERGE